MINLLFQLCLPHKGGIGVFRAIRPLRRALEAALNEVMQNLFQWLTVALIHSKQEAREHDEDHNDCRCTAGQHRFEDKEKRQSDQDAAAETDKQNTNQLKINF